jgi:hypothetical protein
LVDLTKTPPKRKPYSDPAQASPDWNLKSQRRKRLGKLGLSKRIGLWDLWQEPLEDLGQRVATLGLVPDESEQRCTVQGCSGLWSLKAEDDTLSWVCGVCGVFGAPIVPEEDSCKFFLPAVPFRKQVGVVWCLARGYSSEETAVTCSCSMTSVTAPLKGRFDSLIAERQQLLNEQLTLGAEEEELEADEIAFRCKAIWCTASDLAHESEEADRIPHWRVRWLRLMAIGKRFSGKVALFFLPDRVVRGDGRGGGGALSDKELADCFKRSDGTFRVGRRCIIHTDSAKAGLPLK